MIPDEVAIFSKCLHGGKWSEKQTKRAMKATELTADGLASSPNPISLIKALDKDENGLVTPAEFLEFYHQVIYDLEDKAFEKGAGEFEKAGQECKVQRRKNGDDKNRTLTLHLSPKLSSHPRPYIYPCTYLHPYPHLPYPYPYLPYAYPPYPYSLALPLPLGLTLSFAISDFFLLL